MRSKYEIQAQKELQAEGWIVDYKVRPRFSSSHYFTDILGAFDLLAYKPGTLRFISIKGRAGVPAEHLAEVQFYQLPPGCTAEIWAMGRTKQWSKRVVTSVQPSL
jgi:hypothetical protein